MKRCPQCDSLFADTDQYCELDGAPLVSEPNAYVVTEGTAFPGYPHGRGSQGWKIFAVLAGAIVGMAMILFFVYQQTRTPNDPSS